MSKKKAAVKDGENWVNHTNVSTQFLAEVLGLSATMVGKLYQDRVYKQNGKRGKYSLTDAVPAYIQSIKTSGSAEAGAKLKIQQERKLKLANDAAERRLVKIDDAAEVLRHVCVSFRSAISAIPRRMATKLSDTSDAAVCRELLENEYSEVFYEWEKPFREYFGDAWDDKLQLAVRNSKR